MGCSQDREVFEIRQCLRCPGLGDLAGCEQPSDDRQDLEVYELRGSEFRTAEAGAYHCSVGVVIEEGGRRDTRVNDDHGRLG